MKRTVILLLAAALAAAAFACAPEAATAVDTPVATEAVTSVGQTQTTMEPEENAPLAPDADLAGLQTLLLQISTDYQPGSAGCSLRAAKLAGQMLDWYAKNSVPAELLTQAMQAVIADLPKDAAASYAGQFDDIYQTAITLTEDYALDYLESAGYSPEAYPYSDASVDSLFSALQAGLSPEILGYLRRVAPGTPILLDMDGDGLQETVTIATDENAYVTDVFVTGASGSYTDHMDYALSYLSAYVGDAWLGNGGQALFLSGDEASDDYNTRIYRLCNGELQHAEIYGRLVDADEKGVLTIERSIDVFGTYGGVCQYQLQDGFAFSICTPYRVQQYADNWESRKLTVICDGLPAILQNGTDTPVSLQKGTELALLETDQQSYALLENANGDSYLVEIEKHDDDWQWYINGMPEDQCFTPLLYAG